MRLKKTSNFYQSLTYTFAALLLVLMVSTSAYAQVPNPTDEFGFQPGADYKLADYDQLLDYYDKLDASSDRVQKVEIGTTVMGKPMIMLIISSEENMQQLDKWKSISAKMSQATIGEAEARELSKDGKAVVWIDAGLHSTEMAPGQMIPELVYNLTSEETDEMKKIRDNVVMLIMPMMNPDGLDLVSSWYKKNLDTEYESSRMPWLYHYYVGHDNNRDWFMNNMPETQAVTKILYREWYPQIVYNHHQTAPYWTRISIPPFSDPVNQNIPPAVTAGVNEVGAAMAQRFALKEMPGAIADVGYTMFWNGGARTVPYYHNQIGILTETAHASPTPRTYNPESMPQRVGEGTLTDGTSINYPYPWQGGESHFRDAVDYTLTATMAVLDLAADRKQRYLWNIYQMGRDAIEKGESGGPYGYVIPKNNQWDDGEALNLVNTLYQGGVQIEKASNSFQAGGNQYDAGSYIVYAGQAFRPYVMDLLEKQNYPTRLQFPDGPPDPPYDLAGWTLPMQMGVTVDRIDNSFDAQTDRVTDLVTPPAGSISGDAGYGYMLSTTQNASYKAVNALLGEGLTVYRSGNGINDSEVGAFIIENSNGAEDKIQQWADDEGLNFTGLAEKPDAIMHKMNQPKIGLYKSWVASMDEGWTRWIMDTYDFDSDSLHNDIIRGGDLSEYDVIILPSQGAESIMRGHRQGNNYEEYVGGIGLKGSLALENFVKQGGTLVAFDEATEFAIEQFGLPVRDVISGLSSSQFYIPGSLVGITMESDGPLTYGMQQETAASFSRSRAFSVIRPYNSGDGESSYEPQVDVISRYADEDVLMSGWAMGEDRYLAGRAAMLNVKHGSGNIVLFGFRPQFRGQPRGTYKLLFNAIFDAATANNEE